MYGKLRTDQIPDIKRKFYTDRRIQRVFYLNGGPMEYMHKEGNREYAVLTNNAVSKKIAIRGFQFTSPENMKKLYFQRNYDFGTLNNPSNLYVSVAVLSRFPMFPLNLKERNAVTKPFFQKEYHKHIIRYDLYFDFDVDMSKKNVGDDIVEMVGEVNKLVLMLKTFNVNFQVSFSGERGFRVLIPNYNYYELKGVIKIKVAMQRFFSFRHIDPTCFACEPSKLMKALGSICIGKDSKARFVCPLNDDNYTDVMSSIVEMKNFDVFLISPEEHYVEMGDILAADDLTEPRFSYNGFFSYPRKSKVQEQKDNLNELVHEVCM